MPILLSFWLVPIGILAIMFWLAVYFKTKNLTLLYYLIPSILLGGFGILTAGIMEVFICKV